MKTPRFAAERASGERNTPIVLKLVIIFFIDVLEFVGRSKEWKESATKASARFARSSG